MKKHIIVLATRNEGKVREFREMLKGHPVDLRGLNDFGPIPDVVEDGETFDDNESSYTFPSNLTSVPGSNSSSIV